MVALVAAASLPLSLQEADIDGCDMGEHGGHGYDEEFHNPLVQLGECADGWVVQEVDLEEDMDPAGHGYLKAFLKKKKIIYIQ